MRHVWNRIAWAIVYILIQFSLTATMPTETLELQNEIKANRIEYQCMYDSYNNTVENMQDSLSTYKMEIDSLKELNTHFKNLIPKKKYRAMTTAFTDNVTLKSIDVDDRICDCLKKAFDEYEGPQVVMTSGYRHWPSTSDHVEGRAADWRFSPTVVEYLDSEEGKAWLEKNQLDFIIENVNHSEYKNHPKRKYVKWATAPHIHIYLVKPCLKLKSI